MPRSQAEVMLLLAEDARDRGDKFTADVQKQAAVVRAEGAAIYHQLDELEQIVDRAKEILRLEKSRFVQYVRSPQEASAGQAALPHSGVPPHIVRKAAEK